MYSIKGIEIKYLVEGPAISLPLLRADIASGAECAFPSSHSALGSNCHCSVLPLPFFLISSYPGSNNLLEYYLARMELEQMAYH